MLGVTVSFSIILAAATYVVRVAPFAVLAGQGRPVRKEITDSEPEASTSEGTSISEP